MRRPRQEALIDIAWWLAALATITAALAFEAGVLP